MGNEWDANFRSEIKHTLGKIQNAFIRSAEGVLRRKILKTGKKHIKNLHHKKWLNLNCKQIRTNLKRLWQKLSKTPKDHYLREQFFKLKCKYRRICRKEKKKFQQNILQKFETWKFTNNGGFWNLLKQIKGSNFDKQFSNEALPPIQDLSKQYKQKKTTTTKQKKEQNKRKNINQQ